jgi:hypothetical protein
MNAHSEMDVAPRTATEKALAVIWQEIFQETDVTTHSDFFDMGGNSLTALTFLARVDAAFGAETLAPEVLFEKGQLGALAAAIDEKLGERARASA